MSPRPIRLLLPLVRMNDEIAGLRVRHRATDPLPSVAKLHVIEREGLVLHVSAIPTQEGR